MRKIPCILSLAVLAASVGSLWASEPAETATEKPADPFAFADFSWAPGNYAPPTSALATQYFVPEIRLDTSYHYSFNNPKDDTISGSSEVFRQVKSSGTVSFR
jgi:hypothetical protein